ncbi:MAG: PAS domain S-box protein [Spirochaetes bacterium]|nr:PAS domain S-box protein [Spirochaetota bacterium]MBN2770333.1 PAS domain S-box protein [Spirochaetota bacterium]
MDSELKDTIVVIDNDSLYTDKIAAVLGSEEYNCVCSSGNDNVLEKISFTNIIPLVVLNPSLPSAKNIIRFCGNYHFPLVFLNSPDSGDYDLIQGSSSFGIIDKTLSSDYFRASIKTIMNLCKKYSNQKFLLVRNTVDKALFNAMLDTVWIIDLNANVLDVNPGVENVLGYTSEEAMNIGLDNVDYYLSIQEIRKMCQDMPTDKVQKFETIHRRKDGSPLPVEICSTLLTYEGEQAILSIARDISERKAAEQEVLRQLSEKDTLLRAVHHRMKNHIATISNLLMLQIGSVTNDQALSVLQDAIGRVDCMRILYDSLLHGADYTNLSAASYLQSIIDSVISLFPEKTDINVKTDLEELIIEEKKLFPVGVITEELFTNIFKYAYFDKATGNVNVTLKKERDGVVLTIQDDGAGLPAGFDLEKSTGFGLMIVKMLAMQLHAKFTIENNGGTRSKIKLPLT